MIFLTIIGPLKVACQLFVLLFSPSCVAQDPPSVDASKAQIVGYWLTEKVKVGGKVEGGEAGSYFIVRTDKTFRIAKKGRKPEGTWELSGEDKLILRVAGKIIMEATWAVKADQLTVTYQQLDMPVVIEYKRVDLPKEPNAPDE